MSSTLLVSIAACGGGGSEGSADAGVASDADQSAPDGAVSACSATGDHTESDEVGNSPFDAPAIAEASGQTLTAGGAAFTIGGCIDPLQATEDEADGDFYTFTVGGTDPANVRVELTSDGGAMLTDFNVLLLVNGTEGVTLIDSGEWSAAVGGGIVGRITLQPGEYMVAVYAALPAPTAAVPYSLKVLEYTSVCAPASTDYTEATDAAAANRGNDMVEITYTTDDTLYMTTTATDAPEVSGVTVNLTGSAQLAGNSADVAKAGDYRDADTYQISTGDNVDELYVSLAWDGASRADMDFFLFPVLDTSNPVASGTLIGTTGETIVFNVEPNTMYWLWIATYDDMGITLPVNYTVDLCGAISFPSSP